MFTEVSENEIFRNQHGDMVLSGAMGVDKPKEVDGVIVHHLRMISILTPINCFMRKLDGDSGLLPQACFCNMMVLGEGEFAWVDGADLQSAFNLFYFPVSWRGYFTFSKTVCSSVFWVLAIIKVMLLFEPSLWGGLIQWM